MQVDFESLVQKIYQSVLREGDIAIDVGAHTGRHTLPIAEVIAPRGIVYAVEPLPVCRRSLRYTLFWKQRKLRRIIKIMDYALSDYEGQSEFVFAVDAPWFSGLRPRPYDTPTAIRKIPVQVRTFDGLFLNLPALRYIKVDAEGGECHIFMGARQCIEKFRPLVTFEFGQRSLEEYPISPADMANVWFGMNYKLYDILGNPLPKQEDFVLSAERQHVWDYVAIPAEDQAMEATVQETFRQMQCGVQEGCP